MIRLSKRIIFALVALFISAMTVLAGFMPVSAVYGYADTAGNEFDNTSVNEDLAEIDLSQYVFNSNGEISLITFVEYCFSSAPLKLGNYGLYIYIYNPARINISDRTGANRVNMAVSYNADGSPNEYENIPLELCGISTGNIAGLIYKYRVVDDDGIILSNARSQDVSTGARRYDVAGVQLWQTGEPNATDYGVGGTFTFTGYSAGYGDDEVSTLDCQFTELETVTLEVHPTNYRTDSSSAGKDHQNDVASVYFSVDNDILEHYGKLQKIKAEWYEYKTAPIVVTNDSDLYNAVRPFVGKDIGEHTDALDYILTYDRTFVLGTTVYAPSYYIYDWTYNYEVTGYDFRWDYTSQLAYLFLADEEDLSDYYLSSEDLAAYIYGYTASADKGYLDCKEGQVSADLFEDNVDEGRTMGYNCIEIDSDDKFDLLSYADSHSTWETIIDYGLLDTILGRVPSDGDIYGVEPIHKVEGSEVTGGDEAISETLFINENDVADFKEFYETETAADKSVFLFRFALTDYFSGALESGTSFGSLKEGNAFMAQETVFLNFDIIQLTFNLDGEYTVLGVTSNPIDIIGGITPPMEYEGWWDRFLKILVAVILGLLIVIVVIKVISYFVKRPKVVVKLEDKTKRDRKNDKK